MLIARAVFKEEHTAFLLSLRCHLIWYISFFSDSGPNFRHKNVHIFGTTLTALKIQTDLCLADGVLSEKITIWLLGVLENCMWHCYSGLTTWDYDRNRRKQTHTLGTSELAAPLQLTTHQSKTQNLVLLSCDSLTTEPMFVVSVSATPGTVISLVPEFAFRKT